MEATLIPCPDQACLVFPYDRQEDVDAHVAGEAHVYEIQRAGHRKHAPTAEAVAVPVQHAHEEGPGIGGRYSIPEWDQPTDRQKAFFRALLAEREGVAEAEGIRDAANLVKAEGKLTKKALSKLIDQLLQVAKAVKAEAVEQEAPQARGGQVERAVLEAIPAGRFYAEGQFVQVDRPEKGNWAGFIFVKRIVNVGGAFEDVARMAVLNPNARMAKVDDQWRAVVEALVLDPKAAAVEFGRKTGHCCRCGRLLTDPRSIELGIGPVCLESFG